MTHLSVVRILEQRHHCVAARCLGSENGQGRQSSPDPLLRIGGCRAKLLVSAGILRGIAAAGNDGRTAAHAR
jgi:hypothetical protein